MASMDGLKGQVKEYALELGFDVVGIASAEAFSDHEAITLERLNKGLMDGLPWYTESRVRRGCSPEGLLPGAKSIISVGLSYLVSDEDENESDVHGGKVARYSWGDDYHKVIKARLKTMVEGLSQRLGRPVTSPVVCG